MSLDVFERTLIITPHFDDETIGCGGLISKINREGYVSRILVIANHEDMYNYSAGRIVNNEERYTECLHAMRKLGITNPQNHVYQLEGFEDGKLDICDRKSLVTQIDKHIREFKPTAVLFPYSSHHQDHQAVYQASIAALRSTIATSHIRLKAMYEYPYINTWSNNLNVNSKLYIALTSEDLENKCNALRAYVSQLDRDPRDPLSVDAIYQLSRTRGIEICKECAEVYYPMSIVMED